MEMIRSLQNPLVQKCQKLKLKKYRKAFQRFLVEGQNLVLEARKARLLETVLTTTANFEGTLVTKKIIRALATTKTPTEVIGVCKMAKPTRQLGSRVLALENIQDPGNLGTLIRTAKALGWNSVLVRGVDQYNPKVLRATQGAIFTINVVQTSDITRYFHGYDVIAAVPSQAVARVKDFATVPSGKAPLMLVLGNESQGLPKEVIARANYKVCIPVQFESLNVAQAGAILLHHYREAISTASG